MGVSHKLCKFNFGLTQKDNQPRNFKCDFYKTVYIAVGLKTNGLKEVLELWLCKKRIFCFLHGILIDLKARGVENIPIRATDNLNGFTATIRGILPGFSHQICMVHQIKNACRYVAWKYRKVLAKNIKEIYTAPTKEAAGAALEYFSKNWDPKYSYAIKSKLFNWFSIWSKSKAINALSIFVRI